MNSTQDNGLQRASPATALEQAVHAALATVIDPELRSLLEDMLEAQEELRTHDPSGAGSHESPKDKVKEKLKERRDKQRNPRTQQIPKVKPEKSGLPAHLNTPES